MLGTRSQQADVVVVGGGPGGSVAALMQAAAGREVVVLERESVNRVAVGAGILLQPNGLAVLYGLGLRDALSEDSVQYREASFYNDRGEVVADAHIPDFGEGWSGAWVVTARLLLGERHVRR